MTQENQTTSNVQPDGMDEPGETLAFRCSAELIAKLDVMVEQDVAHGYPKSRSAVIRRLLGAALGEGTQAG